MSFVADLGVGVAVGATLSAVSLLWATLKSEGWID